MELKEIQKKYYDKIPAATFNTLISLDPTTVDGKKMGRYCKWILGLWTNGKLLPEDYYKVQEYLEAWHRFRFERKSQDITKLKSLPEVYENVKDLLERKSQSQKNDEIKSEGLELIYHDSHWKVYNILTWEASKLIGAGTQWCTASSHSDYQFKNYKKRGNLIVFVNSNKEKYQYNNSCGLFDATDRSLSIRDYKRNCSYLDEQEAKRESDRREESIKIHKEISSILPMIRKYVYNFDEPSGMEYILDQEFKVALRHKSDSNTLYSPIKSIYDNKYLSASRYNVSETRYYYNNIDCDCIINKETGEIVKVGDSYPTSVKNCPVFIKRNHRYGENICITKVTFWSSGVLVDVDIPKGKGISIRRSNGSWNSSYRSSLIGKDKIFIYSTEDSALIDIKSKEVLERYKVISSGISNCYFYKEDKPEKIYNKNLGLIKSFQSPIIVPGTIEQRTAGISTIRTMINNKSYWFKTNCKSDSWLKMCKITDTSIGRASKATVLSDYQKKEKKFALLEYNYCSLSHQPSGQIFITPYGWTIYNGKVINSNQNVWYTFDINDYLAGLGALANIANKQKPGPLSKRQLPWFKEFWEKI